MERTAISNKRCDNRGLIMTSKTRPQYGMVASEQFHITQIEDSVA